MSKPEFLTPQQLIDRFAGAMTKGTLANWRSKGVGPSYTKMRGRVLYRLSDVEAWEAANSRPTNDNAPTPAAGEAAA